MRDTGREAGRAHETLGVVGPEPAGHWGRAWFYATWPAVALWRRGRNRWLLARGRRTVRRWWRPRTWLGIAFYLLLSVLYLLWLVRSLWPHTPLGSASWLDFSGWRDALATFGFSAATVVAAVWFALYRFRRARFYYLRKAKQHPDELVRPGSIIGKVVGRDPLCDALISDLRERDQRRPHVIVGSIGVGKTALIVRLTQRLAGLGITPVVLQMHDVRPDGELNFTDLAMAKFRAEVLDRVFSGAEAERVWQRLRYSQDRVVVLADGLEDALKGVKDRESKIRKAIADAQEAKLPLVLTSRPQKSLQAIVAAKTVLEPLSEEDALQYVAEVCGWRSDKLRMDWVIEAAQVAESPLYLNIAKDLESRSLLEKIVGGIEDAYSDPRDQDVWALRYDLLDAWVTAVVDGHLYPEQPVSRYGRELTVEYLSALACAALRTNSTYVRYDALDADAAHRLTQRLDKRRPAEMDSAIDERLAGSWGARLGLVEEGDDGVRFQHSVLQAYLASRYLDPLVHEPEQVFLAEAMDRPGRELSMALVFYSRSVEALTGCQAHTRFPAAGNDDDRCPIGIVRERLWKAARAALKAGGERPSAATAGSGPGAGESDENDMEQDPKIRALEMYSTLVDIDCFHHLPRHHDIVEGLRDRWDDLQVYNDRRLDAPKKALIKRIGASGLMVSRRKALSTGADEAVRAKTAYGLLFEIATKESDHGVRFTIAQVIGEGGDDAFNDLAARLPRTAPGLPETGRPAQRRAVDVVVARRDTEDSGYALVYSLSLRESAEEATGRPLGPSASAPVTTRTERLLRKTRAQRLEDQRKAEEQRERLERANREASRREKIMRAWLAPMLVQSCSFTRHKGTPYELLADWRQAVASGEVDEGVQVALAQGLRQAANHRTALAMTPAARDFLYEQAWEMLKHIHYWYARLTLLHALTLWTLPDDVARRQPRHGHGASPARQVKRWLEQAARSSSRPGKHHEHQLVKAAAKLARLALETRRPDRFLWIDEAGTAGQIGSDTSSPREPRLHGLWIPPSRGWSTLDPAAQQLLGDVLVMLTLTEERGDRPEDAMLRLENANRTEPPLLPPCLTRDRSPLDPAQALVGEAPLSLPGSNCSDGCPFELCPYPPKGPQCRTELTELFCIQQRSMLNRFQPRAWRFLRFRRRAPWNRRTSVASLRKFWNEMGTRARDRSLKEASQPQERQPR